MFVIEMLTLCLFLRTAAVEITATATPTSDRAQNEAAMMVKMNKKEAKKTVRIKKELIEVPEKYTKNNNKV